jgi:carbon monoxide dehydrogenase subunit G
MATIESKSVHVNATPEELFAFVQDLRNLRELLPQDKISEWKGEEKHCSFKVTGGYKVGLEHQTLEEPKRIVLTSDEDSPIDFDLDIRFDEEGEGSKASMTSDLKVNAFMRMMVEKPLKNLFDYIADRLQERYA